MQADAKQQDAFYDSLEDVLQDLRAVTMVRHSAVLPIHLLMNHLQDNRDAEAFLRPVSKSELPEYYEGAWQAK